MQQTHLLQGFMGVSCLVHHHAYFMGLSWCEDLHGALNEIMWIVCERLAFGCSIHRTVKCGCNPSSTTPTPQCSHLSLVNGYLTRTNELKVFTIPEIPTIRFERVGLFSSWHIKPHSRMKRVESLPRSDWCEDASNPEKKRIKASSEKCAIPWPKML